MTLVAWSGLFEILLRGWTRLEWEGGRGQAQPASAMGGKGAHFSFSQEEGGPRGHRLGQTKATGQSPPIPSHLIASNAVPPLWVYPQGPSRLGSELLGV